MKHIIPIAAFAAAFAFIAATPLTAYAAPDSTTTKQKTGDGDTGAGDRAPNVISKQQSADGDTGAGDRAPSIISKQRTGDGDTGAGDRAPSIITKQ